MIKYKLPEKLINKLHKTESINMLNLLKMIICNNLLIQIVLYKNS
jgi:hypothetical protein